MNLVVATPFLTINGQHLFALVTLQERKAIAILRKNNIFGNYAY
jgi:hypothetical protein